MSSSEEYLDNLLKALLDSENGVEPESLRGEDPLAEGALDVTEKTTAEDGTSDNKDVLENQGKDPAAIESNKAMSTDEIEEMFASMNDGIVTSDDVPEVNASVDEPDSQNDNTAVEQSVNELISDGAEARGQDGFVTEQVNEMFPDDWALEEELPEETGEAEETSFTDDWALEEESFDEWTVEKNVPEEELPEELPVEKRLPEEEMLSESLFEENKQEGDTAAADRGLEQADLSEETVREKQEIPKVEEFTLNDLTLEEDFPSDELSAEGKFMEDRIVQGEEPVLDDWVLDEEEVQDDTTSDQPVQEDLSVVDPGSTDSESWADGLAEENIMSEEDVDKLLGDDFALEESGGEDEGLSELLASMGQDEDLSEINDLLEKADKGTMEDDEMLALLEDTSAGDMEESDDAFDFWGKDEAISAGNRDTRTNAAKEPEETIPEKKEKKKKEKKGRKSKKKDTQSGMELADKVLAKLSDEEVKPKKQGMFGKFLNFLLEDEEDFPSQDTGEYEAGMELSSISDENKELLAELNAEDKKESGKKSKKKKEPKKKNEKKAKDKKPKKVKKPKKAKKVKPEEPKVPEKRISTTKIVFVILFCSSVAACIIVVNTFIPDHMQKQAARDMYDQKQYEETYELLLGKDLNEEEEALLQKSSIILQVKQKLSSYENYNRLGMQPEALNALVEGVECYHKLRADAEQYGVSDEMNGLYAQLLAELSGNYGVSEEDALNIIASEDDLTYSEKIYGIINGTGIESTDEEQPVPKQDVLPEEEEIIDRLEGLDDEAETESDPVNE